MYTDLHTASMQIWQDTLFTKILGALLLPSVSIYQAFLLREFLPAHYTSLVSLTARNDLKHLTVHS